MAKKKPNTIFQKAYDAIDEWRPSEEMMEQINKINDAMEKAFKKLLDEVIRQVVEAVKEKIDAIKTK